MDNRTLLEEGKRLGHDIRRYHRVNNKYLNRLLTPRVKGLHAAPDLWILADLFNVPEYGLAYPENFLEGIVHRQPFVHLDNAYVDICTRGPLPCGGDKSRCGKRCGHKLSYALYEKSLLNVFLSPLHADTVNGYLAGRFTDKSAVVRPLVNPASFYNEGKARDIDYIYVGTISDYKGYQNIRKRFAGEANFLFIGKNATGEKLFGKHIGHIANTELVHYLNRAKNFVHLPQWKEPMGRTVIEAALCGCNIIANENVGACSFGFDIADPANSRHAATEFWEAVKSKTQ